ncbi:hypothetical protein H7J88_25040 [Mycolicibacterium flavescens]|uniref:Transmembrane protein n=1 Tax=Mycolicibacterium flavescens TaxID=1776 RepID=A0A1E3RG04_MYCFV|nr:hypothetical protein [Mycolicibacterium flavescens]MCV7282907.1 hypothetical protein [Mycolicibacterium flavescens]ODQ88800.1 hypothetical protein BHQ18_18310 [Mycolicibacterium flavescens]
MSVRSAVELVLGAAALVGAVLCFLSADTTIVVPPVLEGEPQTTSVQYSAPLIGLSLLLATVAGVLIVLAVARIRRRARTAK